MYVMEQVFLCFTTSNAPSLLLASPRLGPWLDTGEMNYIRSKETAQCRPSELGSVLKGADNLFLNLALWFQPPRLLFPCLPTMGPLSLPFLPTRVHFQSQLESDTEGLKGTLATMWMPLPISQVWKQSPRWKDPRAPGHTARQRWRWDD